MNNTNTALVALPVAVAPIVEVEVVLPVLLGEQELSLDDAIDRLGEIQDAERKLKKEKDALRGATEATLRANDLETHSTANGRSATCYEQERRNVDKVYLGTVLTAAQFELAFPAKKSKGMRVR